MEQFNDDNEQELVIRNHNRVLRGVNKALRKAQSLRQEYNDALFRELCNTESNHNAELALRRLWEEGGFQPPCGPEDYETIVDTCLRALTAYNNHVADKPVQSPFDGRVFLD